MENTIDLCILIEEELGKTQENVQLKYLLEKLLRIVQLKNSLIKQYKKQNSDLKSTIDKLKEDLEKYKAEKLQLANLSRDQANMILKYQNELEQLVETDNNTLRKKCEELNETHDLYKNSLAAQINKLQQENEKLLARTKIYFKDMQNINEQFLPKYGLQHLLEKIKKKEIIRQKILEEKNNINREQSTLRVFEKDFKQFFKDLQRQKQFDENDLIIVQNNKIATKADVQKVLGRRKQTKGKIKPSENVILIDEPIANKNSKNKVQECIQIGTDDQSAISLENSVVNEEAIEFTTNNNKTNNSNKNQINQAAQSIQNREIEIENDPIMNAILQINKNTEMQIEENEPNNNQTNNADQIEKIFQDLNTDDLFKEFDFLKK